MRFERDAENGESAEGYSMFNTWLAREATQTVDGFGGDGWQGATGLAASCVFDMDSSELFLSLAKTDKRCRSKSQSAGREAGWPRAERKRRECCGRKHFLPRVGSD